MDVAIDILNRLINRAFLRKINDNKSTALTIAAPIASWTKPPFG